MPICRLYRGTKKQLPKSIERNRLAVTIDTREIFIGQGKPFPPRPLTNLHEVAKILAEGFVF